MEYVKPNTQSIAAQAIYNMERGLIPVVFGSQKVFEPSKPKNKIANPAVYLLVAALFFAALFCGYLKNSVSGQVFQIGKDEIPMACDMLFHSTTTGFVSKCTTDAAGRFKLGLYRDRYKVVIVKRPGLPKAYQSAATSPLRVKVHKNLDQVQILIVP